MVRAAVPFPLNPYNSTLTEPRRRPHTECVSCFVAADVGKHLLDQVANYQKNAYTVFKTQSAEIKQHYDGVIAIPEEVSTRPSLPLRLHPLLQPALPPAPPASLVLIARSVLA